MISRALFIGRELSTSFPGFSQEREPWERSWRAMVNKSTDHENDVTVVQFVFFFSRLRFSEKLQLQNRQGYCNKTNRQQLSNGLYSYRPSNDVKMFKTLQ